MSYQWWLCLPMVTLSHQRQYNVLYYRQLPVANFHRVATGARSYIFTSPGDRFTKVIVNRKSKITLKISLRGARIRAFH